MTRHVVEEGRWHRRSVLSWALRLVLMLGPVVVAVLVAMLVSRRLFVPLGVSETVLWWGIVLGASTVALVLTERVARRWGPLVALLHMSLGWPDRAPSRFSVARSASSLRLLRARLQEAQEGTGEQSAGEAAATILSLVTALQLHDRKTRGHAERVRVFTDMLTEELGLPEPDRDRLRWASLVHDIGKLAVSAELLNKPSQLSDEEWTEIRRHPELGAQLCGPLLDWLAPYGDAIGQHHEHFDGAGYPQGLAGEAIGLGARIVAVGDAFEVMTAPRSYKPVMSVPAAREELVAHAGTQFDPAMVRAFLNLSVPRLLLVLGPTAWLAQLPFLARPAAPAPVVSAAVSTGAALTALVVGGVFGPGLPPVGPEDSGLAAPAQEQVIDDGVAGVDGSGATGADGSGTAGSGPAGTGPGGVDPDGTGTDGEGTDGTRTDGTRTDGTGPEAAGSGGDAATSGQELAAAEQAPDDRPPAGGAASPDGRAAPAETADGGGTEEGVLAGGSSTQTPDGTAAAPTTSTTSTTPTTPTAADPAPVTGPPIDPPLGPPEPLPPVDPPPVPDDEPPPPEEAGPVPDELLAAGAAAPGWTTPPSTPPVIELPPQEPPVANDDSVTVDLGESVTIDVLANDVAGSTPLDPSTVRIVEDANPGQTTVNPDGTITFEAPPAPGQGGRTITCIYEVCDEDGACDTATVAITFAERD